MKSSKPHPMVEIDGWQGESMGIVYAVIGEGGNRIDHLAGEVWSVKRGEWWAKAAGAHEVTAVRAASAEEAALMLPRSVAAVEIYNLANAAADRAEAVALAQGISPAAAVGIAVSEFKLMMGVHAA